MLNTKYVIHMYVLNSKYIFLKYLNTEYSQMYLNTAQTHVYMYCYSYEIKANVLDLKAA